MHSVLKFANAGESLSKAVLVCCPQTVGQVSTAQIRIDDNDTAASI
jgi:hypothetical protein